MKINVILPMIRSILLLIEVLLTHFFIKKIDFLCPSSFFLFYKNNVKFTTELLLSMNIGRKNDVLDQSNSFGKINTEGVSESLITENNDFIILPSFSKIKSAKGINLFKSFDNSADHGSADSKAGLNMISNDIVPRELDSSSKVLF